MDLLEELKYYLYELGFSDFHEEVLEEAIRIYDERDHYFDIIHFSLIIRELITQITDEVAPINEVIKSDYFSFPKKRRKKDLRVPYTSRFMFAILKKHRKKDVPVTLLESAKILTKKLVDLRTKLNNNVHFNCSVSSLRDDELSNMYENTIQNLSLFIKTLYQSRIINDILFKDAIYQSINSELHYADFGKLLEICCNYEIDDSTISTSKIISFKQNEFSLYLEGELCIAISQDPENFDCQYIYLDFNVIAIVKFGDEDSFEIKYIDENIYLERYYLNKCFDSKF